MGVLAFVRSCPFLLVDVAGHSSFIKARASSSGLTAFEVEHAALKAHLQIRPFETGIRLKETDQTKVSAWLRRIDTLDVHASI